MWSWPSFRALEHPLAQLQAAQQFYGYVQAFVADEWGELFTDEAPSDEEVEEAVSPFEMLGTLMGLGLRFELTDARNDDALDGYWTDRFAGSFFDVAVYAWMYQVMDATGLEPRAFEQGLWPTNLMFVPDKEGVVKDAYGFCLHPEGQRVRERYAELEALHRRHARGAAVSAHSRRGEGPRETKPAMVDRAALALREEGAAMTPEAIARRMRYRNVASVTAALHQVVMYRRPKRLAGWIVRTGDGLYRWAQ